MIRFSSPYPEVRAVVDCDDDPSLPVGTFRVWFIGTIWCGLGSFINRERLFSNGVRPLRLLILIWALYPIEFFSIRTPSFSLSVNEVQILSYPFAKLLEKILPNRVLFKFRGHSFNLNVRIDVRIEKRWLLIKPILFLYFSPDVSMKRNTCSSPSWRKFIAFTLLP